MKSPAKLTVRIGVLAYRGADTAIKMWTPTTLYLSEAIPGYSFSIVPLSFAELPEAVRRGDVEFVIANSSIYAELESLYGVNRIATLQNKGRPPADTLFGGVLFRLTDRADIKSIEDIKGKSLYAVDETSLGGWQIAWRELKDKGINPYKDLSKLHFAGTHDAVVYAVRDGVADVGTVRTDTLEHMADEGKIDLSQFHILNGQNMKDFPYLLSSRLYPEWPIAKVSHTDSTIAEKVASALFAMPKDSKAALAANIAGWTVAAIYQPVRDLQRELRLGPYKHDEKITLMQIGSQYWHEAAILLLIIVTLSVTTVFTVRANRLNIRSRELVEKAKEGLEQQVQERTDDLIAANNTLVTEISERKQAEHDLSQYVSRLSSFMDAISEAALLLDRNGIVLSANKTVIKRFGKTESEIIGNSAYSLIPAELGELRKVHIDRVIESGKPDRFEDERMGRIIDNSIYPVFDDNGNVTAVAIVGIDITEQKQAAQLIENNEKRLREILSSLGEGVYVLNASGEVTFMNPEAEKILGYSLAELIGKNIHDIVHNQNSDCSQLPFGECPIREVIETGEKFYSSDEVFIRKDGTAFPVSVHSRPLMHDAKIIASVTAFRDISERKKNEQERERLISELQKALAEIKTLHGILPICSVCKKIRNDRDSWEQMESYITKHSDAMFSHGYCPDCAEKTMSKIKEMKHHGHTNRS